MSGSGTVEEVGRSALNIDFTESKFWLQAIQSLHEPMESYQKEITRVVSGAQTR
jgi:hypothetical protein